MTENRSSVIVVGVDDSPASVAALVFAMREGVRRQSAVEAVTVWYFNNPFHLDGGPDLSNDVETGARQMQEHQVNQALEQLDAAPSVSRVLVRDEHTARALLESAQDASFLVVGHMVHKHLSERLLGSTSHHVLRHSHQPVTVVPYPVDVEAGHHHEEQEVAST
jgi:nucleotide-binding universal stress UspA family protein